MWRRRRWREGVHLHEGGFSSEGKGEGDAVAYAGCCQHVIEDTVAFAFCCVL